MYQTPWDTMDCRMPGLPIHHQLPESTQTHVHWVSDAIQPSHTLSSPSPPTFNLFQHQWLFQWVSSSHRWSKNWSFSFSISRSNEYSGFIYFRMDWLDLLAVQGTLKSLLQYHRSKASILRCPAFFIVQLSHPYTTTGKAIALTRQTFFGKVMSLLFNMLSTLIFMAAVTICSDFGAQENKVCYCFHCFPIYLLWSDGTKCHDLSFLNALSHLFHSPLSLSSRGSLVLHLLLLGWCHACINIWFFFLFLTYFTLYDRL